MDIKFKVGNTDIAERACNFAQNMNGVENAAFENGELTVTLAPNGSENVVKSAVEGYIEAMGGKAEAEKPKAEHSRLKAVCRIVLTVILAAVGAVLKHKGVETTPLFLFIAAYIIAAWDVFLSIAESLKEKRRPSIAGTVVCIVSLAMFIIGWYLPAVGIVVAYQFFVLKFGIRN